MKFALWKMHAWFASDELAVRLRTSTAVVGNPVGDS